MEPATIWYELVRRGEVQVIFVNIRDGIYQSDRAVGRHIGIVFSVFYSKAGVGVLKKCLLGDIKIEMDVSFMHPFKFCAYEEIGITHEIYSHFIR